MCMEYLEHNTAVEKKNVYEGTDKSRRYKVIIISPLIKQHL